MSNIVRKGDFLVFEEVGGNVTEFFVSKGSFDLNECSVGRTGRISVPSCFGFKITRNIHSMLPAGHYYAEGRDYLINRKATLKERDRFLRWLEEKGHKVNLNTMEITLNR